MESNFGQSVSAAALLRPGPAALWGVALTCARAALLLLQVAAAARAAHSTGASPASSRGGSRSGTPNRVRRRRRGGSASLLLGASAKERRDRATPSVAAAEELRLALEAQHIRLCKTALAARIVIQHSPVPSKAPL